MGIGLSAQGVNTNRLPGDLDPPDTDFPYMEHYINCCSFTAIFLTIRSGLMVLIQVVVK